MRTTEVINLLTAALDSEAQAQGFELVAVEQSGGRGMPVVRVLLDRNEGGLDLDDIAAASSWVAEIVEAQDPFGHPYTLEVSSPGIDRPLVKPRDFVRFVGETVNVKTQGYEKRHAWTGELLGMEGDDVLLLVDGERVAIPFHTIHKARLKGAVDFGNRRERSA
jgi:ribosome maturation factor RimP